MSVRISGVLKDGAGKPVQACTIELRSGKTSPTVVVHIVAECITDSNGRYVIEAEPGFYDVFLLREGWAPARAGEIYVAPTDKPDTLNAFLDAPKDGDLRPEVMKRFEKMVNEVARNAEAAKASETNARASETAAASSENAAKTSETNAAASAKAAKTSETNAGTSEAAAAQSASAAEGSKTAAEVSAGAASTSAREAADSATAAGKSAESAASSASAATAKATETTEQATAARNAASAAKTSEANARTSETNAAASAEAAETSAKAAKTSETNARASETDAASSKTAAETSAREAASSASSASASKDEAGRQASAAAESAGAAASAADRAETAAERAEKSADEVDLKDATTTQKGIVQLSSATDSESESLAATPKAVKRAMDNASARLAKDRNGDDIPDKDLFARNISAALAYGAEVDTLRGGSWTTEEFIDWLETRGAFNHPYWMCRTGWNTLNKIITDTGCGDVQLCDTVIEVMGNRSALTIRITTSGKGTRYGLNSAQFIYTRSRYSNDGHWRRDLCRSGDTMDGELKLRGPDALRIFDDAFGVVFRRSDDCLYLIPTAEGKGENGAAGGLRPFIINLKTGKVSMKNGTDVEGGLSVGGRLTVGSEIAIGNSPMTGFKNNAGSLEVYCNNNHIFLFKNGILESYKPVNISGRVTPSDYGNFDARYSRKTETVQDIRYGSEMYYDPGGNEISWIFRAPSGHGLSGINVQDTGTGSADNIGGVWYRPLQKLINGTWYNVASV